MDIVSALFRPMNLSFPQDEENPAGNRASVNPQEWQDFLHSLYSKFSAYEIQKVRDRYNVADIENWGSDGKPSGIVITENNFEKFLSKIVGYNLTNHDVIKNGRLTVTQMKELNHVLENVLKHEITMECKKPSIYIKGNFISLNDILNNTHLVEMEGCRSLRESVASGEYKFVNIFASNTVFLDYDIDFSGLRQSVSIITPKWVVIGTRNINLSGIDGKPPYKIIINKLRLLTKNGYNGDAGKPGSPGSAGGNFFGIGDEFVRGSYLTIVTKGGNGSSGLDGEPGGNGMDGKDAVLPDSKFVELQGGFLTSLPEDICGSKSLCDNYFRANGMACTAQSVNKVWYKWDTSGTYLFEGIDGGRGGDGGDGGKGGEGGFSGQILMANLSDISGISEHSIEGKKGQDGKGGPEGVGGYCGNDIIANCWFGNSEGASNFYVSSFSVDHKRFTPRRNGRKGIDGKHTVGLKKPEPKVEQASLIIISNEYKAYIRQNLKYFFNKPSLMKFLFKLDTDKELLKIYDTSGLVNDFNYLEKQVHELSKDIDVVPFYRFLLQKIDEYSREPKQRERSSEYKKILGFLYTTTLSRIYKFKEDLESNMIIDIDGYLDIVQQNIKDLKDLQKAKNKVDIIKLHKENYETRINMKIKEANDFIQNQIAPEIQRNLGQIKNKIYTLVDETIKLQEKAIDNKKELINLKLKLANTFESRGIFRIFESVGQIVDLLGPAGKVAGSTIGQLSSMIESLVIDDKNTDINTLKLPDAVEQELQAARGQVENLLNKRALNFITLLDTIAPDIKSYPDVFGDMTLKMDDMKNKLQKFPDLKSVRDMEETLKEIMKQKEKELQSQIKVKRAAAEDSSEKKDNKHSGALKALKKSQVAFKFLEFGFDMYNQFKDNEAKLDAVSRAIEEAEKNFKKLKEFEEKIYDKTIPMLKNISDNLNDIANKLGTKSKVSLQVTQWQVHSVLKDLKLYMHNLAKGFENLEDDLPHCVETLEEAMMILIEVYGSIQDYQEQQNLSNYIADISSVTASNIKIPDEKLSYFVTDLEISIKSNLVLKQYEVAMNSFKQFVFPLAQKYLKDLKLPSQLELEKNLENLVEKAAGEIDAIKSQINIYRKSIASYDKDIRTGEFKNNYISTSPFYTWRSEHHKNIISDLLSGNEIVVKADVKGSQMYKDAIKFKYIDINFNSKNSTIKSRIDETMKAFSVRAIHMGNSYYRFENKTYLIPSESQTIDFYFEKNRFDEPVDKNEVYIKIKRGDFLLSPYTVWKFKLFNVKDVFTFQDLNKFKNDVDMELVGEGKYINSRYIEVDLNVDKYYKVIHDLEESENEEENEINKSGALDRANNKYEVEILDENNQGGVDRLDETAQVYSLQSYRRKQPQLSQDQSYENIQHKSPFIDTLNKWFSWLRLPNFRIFPGAEAATTEDFSGNIFQCLGTAESSEKSCENAWKNRFDMKPQKNKEKERISKLGKETSDSKNPISTIIESVFKQFQNGLKFFSQATFPKSTNQLTIDEPQNNLNLPPAFHGEENFQNKLAIATDNFSNNTRIQIQINKCDLNGNLLLGNLFARTIFGMKSENNYLSPELERRILIEKLANKILPIVQRCDDDDIDYNYDNQDQYWNDISTDNSHESEQHLRQKDGMIFSEDLPEDLFLDSGAMLT